MEKRELLREGTTKRIYGSDRDNVVIIAFTDDFVDGGATRSRINGKGEVNAAISSFLFQYLENYHVPTHFIERVAPTEIAARRLVMFPFEVVVHNVAAADLAQRFHLEDGKQLDFPITEFCLKSPKIGNPMVNESHAVAFGHAKADDMKTMNRMASKANAILKSLFERRQLQLVSFRLEFGTAGDQIYVADEISPDVCRIWDKKTNRRLERERYVRDPGGAEKLYRELLDRLAVAS